MLDACGGPPSQELIPYLVSPADGVTPGVPAYYATTCRACPAGCGLVAKVMNGRVTKAEGNPEHPVGAGRLCARGQATVQSIYNPHRFRQPLLRDDGGTLQPLSWGDGAQLLAAKLREAKQRGFNRVAWIGRTETGPFDLLVADWLKALGSAVRLTFEPLDCHALREGAERSVGRREIPQYDFDRAELVLAFGAEFLETWLSNVEFTAAYARLRARAVRDPVGCFVWIAPRLSLTGLNADQWIAVPPGSEAVVACAIAHAIVADGLVAGSAIPHLSWIRPALAAFAPERVEQLTGARAAAIRVVAREFC